MVIALIMLLCGPHVIGAANSIEPARALAPGVTLIPAVPPPATKLNGARNANVVIVSGPQGSIAWNGGVSYQHGQELLRVIRAQVTTPLRALVISHAYQDVLFGWGAFAQAGIPVWMHRAAVKRMHSRCQDCLANLKGLLGEAAMTGTTLADPSRQLDGPQQIRLTGNLLELLDYGHTSGPHDLALYDRKNQVLLSGALVFTSHLGRIGDANIASWISALDQLLQMPISLVIPNYGSPSDRSAIVDTRKYLNQLGDRAAQLLADQVGLLELSENGHLSSFAHLDAYRENHAVNLQTVYLQKENAQLR